MYFVPAVSVVLRQPYVAIGDCCSEFVSGSGLAKQQTISTTLSKHTINSILSAPHSQYHIITAHRQQHTISDALALPYHTINSTPSTANHQQHAIKNTPSTAHHQQHTINSTPSTTHHQQHTINNTPSTARDQQQIINSTLSTPHCQRHIAIPHHQQHTIDSTPSATILTTLN